MNTTGILFGLYTAVVIGLGFVWVIKLEYYVGAHVARATAGLGIILALGSLFIPNFTLSALIGILGGSIVWGSTELEEQEQRVAEGIFPANPAKRPHQTSRTSDEGSDGLQGGGQ